MKPEKITMESVTQEHLDLLNAFLLGVVPTFSRPRGEQAKCATDAGHEIAWALLDKAPKGEWSEPDADFIAQFYQNFRDGLTGVRIFLNEVQAVSSAKRRYETETGIAMDVKDRVAADRKKAFAQRDEPKVKRGAPRLSPEEKQIRAFRNMNMPWDSIAANLKMSASLGLSKMNEAQISSLIETAQKAELA